MVLSEKCNCCIHEPVCKFKEEYLAACEAIKDATYCTGTCVVIVKDSRVSVSIKCPNMMAHSATRREFK